jgi:hypothetical protein
LANTYRRREMNYGVHTPKCTSDRLLVANVAPNEFDPSARHVDVQVDRHFGVGTVHLRIEVIQDRHFMIVSYQLVHGVRPDESGAPGNQDFHETRPPGSDQRPDRPQQAPVREAVVPNW